MQISTVVMPAFTTLFPDFVVLLRERYCPTWDQQNVFRASLGGYRGIRGFSRAGADARELSRELPIVKMGDVLKNEEHQCAEMCTETN